MPTLVVESGSEMGTTHSIEDGSVLGRVRTCDVTVRDGEASRNHARIVRDGDDWILEDLDSSNGTRLNEEPVGDPVPLAPQDRIRIGATVLVFVPDEAGGPGATAEVDVEESLEHGELGPWVLLDPPRRRGVLEARRARGPDGEAVVLRPAGSAASDDVLPDAFVTRAEGLAALDLPAAVAVREAGRIEGTAHAVEGLPPGPDLAERLAGSGPLAPEEAISVVVRGVELLRALHRAGTTHGGPTPRHLFLPPSGLPVFDPLALPGAESWVDDPRLAARVAQVTAPELAAGETPSPAADVFGLGALVTWALRGEPPYPGETAGEVHGRKDAPPDLSGGGPAAGLGELLASCLDPEPDRRPGLDEVAARLTEQRAAPPATPPAREGTSSPPEEEEKDAPGDDDPEDPAGGGTGPPPDRRARRRRGEGSPRRAGVSAPARTEPGPREGREVRKALDMALFGLILVLAFLAASWATQVGLLLLLQ